MSDRTVHLSIWPGRDVTVSESEYEDLSRMGLLTDETPDVSAPAGPAPAPLGATPAPAETKE